MKINCMLFVLLALSLVQATKPITFNLRKNSFETRGYISSIIENEIKSMFPNKQTVGYIKYDTHANFYYNTPRNTTLITHNGLQVYYNVYHRNNNTNTITHVISVKSENSNAIALEILVKIFQDKISFQASSRNGESMGNNTIVLLNSLENAIIRIGEQKANIDQYQLKRLANYI
ncbi:hypothetical protein NEMIN01_0524 [Nematocida minor]|uniref:uncharacterized protein n=1 Tax=Nematocida minor TaxID=1912983 RepID=UPI0022210956|nr:uncharacterized protein NEMIN01_0524 [Nematocida minor]KAI5189461.1 hypothetical protein NEMIN01_0524 [Nematocida minor]